MNDSVAFTVFVAIFCGGLAVLTMGMAGVVAGLIRRNRARRQEDERPTIRSGRRGTDLPG